MRTPYEILEISSNATTFEIRNAFRAKAKQTHPDLNLNDIRANEKFIEVTNAYKILSDPVLKKELDNQIFLNIDYPGFDSDFAYDMNSQMLTELIKELIINIQIQAVPYKKEAIKVLWIGLAWFVGGLAITLWSYSAVVNNGGGSYVVTYGAIIFGIVQAIRGFIANNEINDMIVNYENDLWLKFDNYIAGDYSFYNDGNKKSNDYKSENKSHSESINASNPIKPNMGINTDNYTINQSNKSDDRINKPLLVSCLICIVLVIYWGAGYDDSLERNRQSNSQNQITTESIVQSKNFLSSNDCKMLIEEINYETASDFMGGQYTTNELRSLVSVFYQLEYKISSDINDLKYNLIAFVVHFQKDNDLEVDGMAGPNTLKALSQALTIKKEGANVEFYVYSDAAIVKEYGWNSQKIQDFVYFVTYEFDYDNSYDNGLYVYPYEVNLLKQSVTFIEGALIDKYRYLGYLE